jgi:Cu/Ag efflux pump CusA
MVRKLIEWALNNPMVVFAYVAVVIGLGIYSYTHINVEAYPDPAPPIIELIAQNPGASAEEMERLVTVPLEINLAGMPNLKTVHTKSLFELSHVRCIFHYGHPYDEARQEVINRLAMMTAPLPPGVTAQLSPANPIAEIYRYVLKTPKNALGEEIYTLNDLKALQDWLIEREFRRVPGVFDVTSFGGTVKRYEIHPDPERMKRYGLSLQQVSQALTNSNMNVSGDFLKQGSNYKVIIIRGLIGGHKDPMEHAMTLKTPEEAAAYLRAEELRRCNEIRSIVVTSINSKPIRIDDIVDGGPLPFPDAISSQGVVVSHQTRLGRVSYDKCLDHETGKWLFEDEKVEGIILMRKNQHTMPVLERVKAKVDELNGVQKVAADHWYERIWDWCTGNKREIKTQSRLLPGIELQNYYDREELVNRTTHTVRENLFLGIALVVVILMMFISNVRTALIVAINMPLALLFSFSVLYFRGKSANLLSIGAVDFGIIVDSTVIMAENIYRHFATQGEHSSLSLKDRIVIATREIDKALFFSTAIMVVAFIPLFTMQGAEGELFGPMAQTYAFSLIGALFLAMTLTPVLCMYFYKGMKPKEDNFAVRFLKQRYLWQLRACLKYRYTTVIVMVGLMVITAVWPLRYIGREFMPELEEGNLWIRGIFPVHEHLDSIKEPVKEFREIVSYTDYTITKDILDSLPNARWLDQQKQEQRGVPDQVIAKLRDLKDRKFEGYETFLDALRQRLDASEVNRFRQPIMKTAANRKYPEVEAILVQMGRPDDGTDPGLFNNVEVYVPFRPQKDWPKVTRPNGITKVRSRQDITTDLSGELVRKLPGVEWAFSQYIRDNVMEAMTGVKGDNCVKIYGPDLKGLEEVADKVKDKLLAIRGVEDVGVYRVMGQSNLEFVVDKKKCERWGLQVADVAAVIGTLVHGGPMTSMVEGEKIFDVTLRLPLARRQDEASILDATVDVWNRTMTPGSIPATLQTILTGPSFGAASPSGTMNPPPTLGGSLYTGPQNQFLTRLRLRDVVSPVDDMGRANPGGEWTRPAGSIITRELGKRFIAAKFAVRDRDLASAVAEVEEKTSEFIKPPYRVQFGGEFEQMQDAEGRLMLIIPASLVLIFILLYVAFRSLLDVMVILSNVFDLAIGGVWAMYLTGTHLSVSASVGFVSLFGVAIMDGLLMISYFNDLRIKGMPVNEAIMHGASLRVRPVTMTCLTAILGLLPAAISTAIGSQTQRPLAIVVVGGMASTLLLTRYLMPVLYSFYGHREPPKDAASLAH